MVERASEIQQSRRREVKVVSSENSNKVGKNVQLGHPTSNTYKASMEHTNGSDHTNSNMTIRQELGFGA